MGVGEQSPSWQLPTAFESLVCFQIHFKTQKVWNSRVGNNNAVQILWGNRCISVPACQNVAGWVHHIAVRCDQRALWTYTACQSNLCEGDRMTDRRLDLVGAYDGCSALPVQSTPGWPAASQRADCVYSICVIGYWTLTSHGVTRLTSQNRGRDASASDPGDPVQN